MRSQVAFAIGSILLIQACQSSSGSVPPQVPEDVVSKPLPPRPLASRPIVAVLDFEDKSGMGEGDLGSKAAESLFTALVRTENVRVVDKSQIQKAMAELKMQHSGQGADPAKIGRVLNAKYVVTGTVSSIGMREVRERESSGLTRKAFVAQCELSVRIVDVQTGMLAHACEVSGTAEVAGPGVTYDPALPDRAIKAAAAKAVDDLLPKFE